MSAVPTTTQPGKAIYTARAHTTAYSLQARLNVSLPSLEREVAEALTAAAHQTCPYSKATRGNIDVVINVV